MVIKWIQCSPLIILVWFSTKVSSRYFPPSINPLPVFATHTLVHGPYPDRRSFLERRSCGSKTNLVLGSVLPFWRSIWQRCLCDIVTILTQLVAFWSDFSVQFHLLSSWSRLTQAEPPVFCNRNSIIQYLTKVFERLKNWKWRPGRSAVVLQSEMNNGGNCKGSAIRSPRELPLPSQPGEGTRKGYFVENQTNLFDSPLYC